MFDRTNSFSAAKLLHVEVRRAIITNALTGPEAIALSAEIDNVYNTGGILAELPQALPELAIWAMGRLLRPDEESLQRRVRDRRANAYFEHLGGLRRQLTYDGKELRRTALLEGKVIGLAARESRAIRGRYHLFMLARAGSCYRIGLRVCIGRRLEKLSALFVAARIAERGRQV